MEVIAIESEAFAVLMRKLDNILNLYIETANELKTLKDNRLMSIAEVAEYTGFNPKWVHERKVDIGYSQPGKDIRFYKDDIDAYFKRHKIQRKA
jgi:predicted DNA-binding transcriptional regulator AlpA